MGSVPPQLDFLATFSEASLESFELSRMNLVANLRKELHQLVDQWIEAEIESRIARWLLKSRGATSCDPDSISREPSLKPLAIRPTPGHVVSPAGSDSTANAVAEPKRGLKVSPRCPGIRRPVPPYTASRSAPEMPLQSSLFPEDESAGQATPPTATADRACETLRSLEQSIRSRNCPPQRSHCALERTCSRRLVPADVGHPFSPACSPGDHFVTNLNCVLAGVSPPSSSDHFGSDGFHIAGIHHPPQ
jgi:hypothetical protein